MKKLLIVLLVVPLVLAAGCAAQKRSTDYTGHSKPTTTNNVEANYPWDLESM